MRRDRLYRRALTFAWSRHASALPQTHLSLIASKLILAVCDMSVNAIPNPFLSPSF